MALFWQARLLPVAPCRGEWRRRSAAAPLVCARKRDETVWEDAEGEIELDKSDLMQLKFSRLLGESRETSIAKAVARKLNPHLNNLEIHKLVKKRGATAFMRLVSDSWKDQAVADASPSLPQAEAPQDDGGVAIALAPKPLKPRSPQQQQNEATATLDAVNADWMKTEDISLERFVKLLNDQEMDVRGKAGAGIRPAAKFDRRPRRSASMVRRRARRSSQMSFSANANANRKLTKNKGKGAK